MPKFIFTFGSGQAGEGFYQPIYAKDYGTARTKMIEMFGKKWAFQYLEEEWLEWEAEAEKMGFPSEKPLEAVQCKEEEPTWQPTK